MRKFKRQWREAAQAYAARCWHTSEYRYWSADGHTKLEVAEVAAKMFRSQLNQAYAYSVKHPRSKKTIEKIRELARVIGSIGLYILEHSPSN